MKPKTIAASLALVFLSGCHITNEYSATVDAYVDVEHRIELGMSLAEVTHILDPTQRYLDNTDRRHDERYLQGETEVLIRFYRSGWQADGRLTDDEYTPYVFHDERLVAIGWQLHRTAML